MFKSATVKLTVWYMTILMVICLLFSIVIYKSVTSEIDTRLQKFEAGILNLPVFPTDQDIQTKTIRSYQAQQAAHNLISSLIYTNILILFISGVGSYLLARRTLRPIEQSLEAQAQFSADASHELRTPLAAMKAEIEVALRDKSTPKTELRELLESNLEEVDKLSELSTTLLKLAREDESGITMAPVNLLETLQSAARRTREQDRFDLPLVLPAINLIANRPSLEEAVYILMDNALKYGARDKLVEVRAKKRATKVLITVSNQGEGIEPEHLDSIFNRFYRVDNSRTQTPTSGHGLGLSVARQLVKLHRGEINVKSTPGKTTTFTISLPIKTF